MYKGLKEYYDALGLEHVVVLKIDWEQENHGSKKEFTKEEIACKHENKFYQMTVKMEYGSAWSMDKKKYYVLNKKEISEEKFQRLKYQDLTRR